MTVESQTLIPKDSYPPLERGTIIVWGLLAGSPFGGMVWQVYHYLVALRRLGFDVWYVEDSEKLLFDPVTYDETMEYEANVRLLSGFMESVGLGDRWVFRPPGGVSFCLGGTDKNGLGRLYREASAVINLCGAQEIREEYADIRCLVYLETDPVRNQVDIANGDPDRIEELDAYRHLFTYGENLGASDCLVPMERYEWRRTRPPVCLDLWKTDTPPAGGAALTSVANWKHEGKDVVWEGEAWRWSKHHEFLKVINLPARAKLPVELAVGAIGKADREKLHDHGWRTHRSGSLQDPLKYRSYIQESLGEFTVAKEQYVRPRSGWFSDRSVCYLAAGRPVILQDTAFGKFVPTGEGLFAYSTEDEALAAIDAIASDYTRHSKAAREIAREYFEAERVVGDLLRQIGLL